MRMRTAACLHRSHLFRIPDVRDIEDSYASETLRACRRQSAFLLVAGRRWRQRRKTLRSAVKAPIRHFYLHEQQVSIYRNVALSARTYKRCNEGRLGRIGNIVETHTIKIALKQVRSLECEIGICKGKLRNDRLHCLRNFRFVANTEHIQRFLDSWIIRIGG